MTDAIAPEADVLHRILACVRACTGLDFSHYREPTMRRRVHNRMIGLGLRTFQQYLERLEREPQEAGRLVERLTIKVSRFYRNAPVFERLRHDVLPSLAVGGEPLRLWSAGCGRGEEAYTLAMLLAEQGIAGRVLATDIDPFALKAAAEGVYPAEAIVELPVELRERFLEPLEGGRRWRASDALRARIEFCRHDLLGPLQPRDASFHLVACRNLVIYLRNETHERAMTNARAAIAPGGVLVLGEAEWPSPSLERTLVALASRLRMFRAREPEAA